MKFALNPAQVFTILISVFFLSSCGNDDTAPINPDNGEPDFEIPITELGSRSYAIGSIDQSNISGSATLVTFSNDSTIILLKLANTPVGGMHPAHIHFNTAAEGGDIAITLATVDGSTGRSTTHVKLLDDGTTISSSQLLDFDGYINVHLSADNLETLVSQGDIGQNQLTGESKEYVLGSKDVDTIDGTATFFERLNGEALAVIMLNGTTDDGTHPGHIHANSATEGGDILFTFNPVVGATGISRTNVDALDDDTVFRYSEVLTIDGYINIHLNVAEVGTIIAQGNIGANEGEVPAEESKNFVVTNNGSSSYVFNSDDVTNLENPDLTLKRGETYTFAVNAPGHPFFIKLEQGNSNANAYNNGVSNNGTESETITFIVPMDAPDTLFYNCQFHSIMTGTLNIID